MSACPPFDEGPDTDFDIPAVLDSSGQHQEPAVSPAVTPPPAAAGAAAATSPGSTSPQRGPAAGCLREAHPAASSALSDRGVTLDQQGLGAGRPREGHPAASPDLGQAGYASQGLLRMAQEAERQEGQPARPRRVVSAHQCWPCETRLEPAWPASVSTPRPVWSCMASTGSGVVTDASRAGSHRTWIAHRCWS